MFPSTQNDLVTFDSLPDLERYEGHAAPAKPPSGLAEKFEELLRCPYLMLICVISLPASCADETAAHGTRAYALHKGMKRKQIDDHVGNYNSRGFQSRGGNIELLPGKAQPEEDLTQYWERTPATKKGEAEWNYNPPGLVESILFGHS